MKIPISILILISSMSIFGQKKISTKEHKWTISTILLSENVSYFNNSFNPNYFEGFILKRNLGAFKLRVGGNFSKQITTLDQNENRRDAMFNEGESKTTSFLVGAQKNIYVKNWFKSYVAFDLTLDKTHSDIISSGGFTGVLHQREIRDIYQFAANPTIGINFPVNKWVSFSLETRFQIVYTKTNKHIVDLTGSSEDYFDSNKDLNKRINRISLLSFNIHF